MRSRKPNRVKSRKEIRKEARKGKKAMKHQFYLARKQHNKYESKPEEVKNETDRGKGKTVKHETKKVKVSKNNKKETDVEKLKKEFNKTRTERLKKDNLLEDQNIKKLEKQLKLKKGKTNSVPKTFANDGLDYLLEMCNKDKMKEIIDEDSSTDLDFDSDLDDFKEGDNKQDVLSSEAMEDEDENMESDNEQIEAEESEETEESEAEEEGSGESETDDELPSDKDLFNAKPCIKEQKVNNETWEDIYGRTRDKAGNVIQHYVPPHLKKKLTDNDGKNEKLLRLKRQLKGLLNRLAESNIANIATQIDQLYMSNSRNDMNATLGQLLIDSLVALTLTPERLIMEHCLLIALLHANVGTEVGAYFLQLMTNKFNKLISMDIIPVEDKTINNIVLILSYLYFFKIFHCVLMYDILNKLMLNLEEKQVELILTVLKTVGFNLRKDDPVALKNFVLNIQNKSNEYLKKESSSRLKFMLEIVLAIKNNNMSKIPNYDPEHGETLRKLLKTLLRKGNNLSELKISLQDLLSAEEHGRWWVVGSAWSGTLPGKTEQSAGTSVNNTFSKKLLDLARKQRMNTDVRRNIFCILMSSEDYLDAFEKLIRLGLKGQPERDIINVIVHCCLQEKVFNPYYVHLAGKFCTFDRKFQMMLQYSIWDRVKQLNTSSNEQISSLARLLSSLILAKDLPLSVMKVVEFSELDKTTVRFVRHVLLNILLNDNEESVTNVFDRISQTKQLKLFRQSIRLFIHHFLLKKTNKLDQDRLNLLTKRTELVDKILCTTDYSTVF